MDRILADTPAGQHRAELLAQLEDIVDPRIERYWKLTAIISGRPAFQSTVPAFEWLMAALESHDSQSRR